MIRAVKTSSLSFLLPLCFINAQAFACNVSSFETLDSPFELSLQELLNVQITGAAVRTLSLDSTPITNNPLARTNCSTPSTVDIIESRTIDARGLRNVIEVVENVPGVLSGESPAEPYSFSMRGFSSDSVNVLYDGISLGPATANTRPQGTGSLERVEITKGPSSLHHGQGAAGGAVNMISKSAADDTELNRKVLLAYGIDDTMTLNGGIAGPLSESITYLFDVNLKSSNGWVDASESEFVDTKASVFWRLSPTFNAIFSLTYQEDELPAYWGTPLIPAADAINPVSGVVKNDDGRVIDKSTIGLNYNVADRVIESESLWARMDFNWLISDDITNHTTIYNYSADRRWQNAESYMFDNATKRIERDRFLVTHDRKLRGLNSSTVFQGSIAGLPNQFSATLEYSKNDFDRTVGFDNPFFVDDVSLYKPVSGQFGTVNSRPETIVLETTALVFDNRIDLTDALQLDFGLRLENLDVDRQKYNFSGVLIPRTSIDKDYNQSSYFVGLNHQLTDSLNVYGHYTKQHGLLDNDFRSVYEVDNFKPSDITQKEVGLKGFFNDQRVELTFALYEIEKELRSQAQNQGFETSERSSRGAELSLHLSVTPDVKFGGNIAYTDAEYGYYLDLGDGADVSNNVPVNAPAWMASVWGSVNRIGGFPIEIGGGINFVDDRFANTANTKVLQSYTLVNLFTAYTHRDFRLALHVRNVTNEIYAPWSDVNYPDQIILGSPRTAEISFQKAF